MESIKQAILENLPLDGSHLSSQNLIKLLRESGLNLNDEQYEAAKEQLIIEGKLAKGRGRGGAVYRTDAAEFGLISPSVAASAPTTAQKKPSTKKRLSARKKPNESSEVLSYRYDEKRTNNPHVGMVDTYSDGIEEKKTWAYDTHIDPALNFDSSRAQVEKLIDDALGSGDLVQMQSALEQLKRMQSPYLKSALVLKWIPSHYMSTSDLTLQQYWLLFKRS